MHARHLALLVCACAIAFDGRAARADGEAVNGTAAHELVDTLYQTRRFVLHTDLPAEDARIQLAEMDQVLEFAERYWRRPQRGRIECYLVKNLDAWPDSALPHPLARIWIGRVSGATTSESLGTPQSGRLRTTVYASTSAGVIEHEIVHAYCCQTFGATGPDWYKEGMANAIAYRAAHRHGVHCPPDVLTLLRTEQAQRVDQIVRSAPFTRGLQQSLNRMVAQRTDPLRHVPVSAWSDQDARLLTDLREFYSWSWLVCHMLMHNPNYGNDFRKMGERYLSGEQDAFAQLFGEVQQQMEFEFAQMTANFGSGYRADLCHWDWAGPTAAATSNRRVSRRITAARGYQSTGLVVERGRSYSYLATGSWRVAADAPHTDARGAVDGSGRLVAVVAHDGQLSEPIELSAEGTLSAPASGPLHVRCRDAWHEISDNEGDLRVQISW